MTDDARLHESGLEGSLPPRQRLELAVGLDRAGQTQAAVAALLPALTDRSVRAAVAAHPNLRYFAARPAWSHRDGNAGRSRFLPVAGLGRPPIVRWTRRIENAGAHTILASPLGVVCASSSAWLVLDPETGNSIFEVPGRPFPADPAIVGHVLLSVTFADRVVVGHDLWTGRELWKLSRPVKSFFAGEGWLETHWDAKVRDRFELLDPASQPKPSRRFTESVRAIAGVTYTGGGAGGDTHAISSGSQWTIKGVVAMADDMGAVSVADGAEPRCILSQGERELWSVPCKGAPAALLPEGVVVLEDGRELSLLERASGERNPMLSLKTAVSPGRQRPVLAAARGVVYVAESPGEIAALTPEGDVLWRFASRDIEPTGEATIASLVPGPGRLYGHLGNDAVFCLEEGVE